MKIITTPIADLIILEPKVFGDHRGFFMETYSEQSFRESGLHYSFVQDNHAKSSERGVLRGLHFQGPPKAQAKLVRVIRGSVYDVAVDIRKNSPTFGRWYGLELSSENKLMFLIPRGFAHAYCSLEPDTEFIYKVDNLYAPEWEDGIIWNDPDLRIPWPVNNPVLSVKDQALPSFAELRTPFI